MSMFFRLFSVAPSRTILRPQGSSASGVRVGNASDRYLPVRVSPAQISTAFREDDLTAVHAGAGTHIDDVV